MASTGSGTQAVDRAAALVSLVVGSEAPISFTELSEEAGLARSTTSRLLAALERADLLDRDPEGNYFAGPLFAQYASRHNPQDDFSRLARPALDRLRDATGETANLGVPHGNTVEHLAQADSRYLLGTQDWTQLVVPPYASALGRVLYAYGALPLPSGPWPALTSHTIADAAALAVDLAQVRRRGYAVTVDELEIGLTGLAAPILRGTAVVAAIGISGPTARLKSRVGQVGRLLVEQADAVSGLLSRRTRTEGAA